MSAFWDTLSPPWQACLEEAWLAYCVGSIPIGAVITSVEGEIISRGRNRINDPSIRNDLLINTKLSHAELNALNALPDGVYDRHTCQLYTVVEPCPLCLGALYMSGLRQFYYAARDPWAGSVNLLGTTPYLSRKPLRAIGPSNPELEQIIIAIQVTDRLQQGSEKGHLVMETWRELLPSAVAFGEQVFTAQILPQFSAKRLPVPTLINQLYSLLLEFRPVFAKNEIPAGREE